MWIFIAITSKNSISVRTLGSGCVYKPNSNNLKIWKCLYLKKNLHVRVVIDNVDPGPRSNLLSKNIHQKSRDTVPLTPKQGFLIIFCKGQTKFVTPVFSHNSKQSGPFIYMLKYFCKRFRFGRIISQWRGFGSALWETWIQGSGSRSQKSPKSANKQENLIPVFSISIF